jgi:mRNA-binding protein PUF3
LKDSPARHRHSDHSAPPQSLKDSLRNSSSYFPSNRPSAIGQGMGPSPSKPLLNHSPTTFQPRVPESSHYDNFQPKKLSDDVRRQFSNGALGGYSTPSGVQVMRGGFVEDLTSDDGMTTSNGNLASSRDGMGIESMSHMAAGSNGSMPYAHYSRASASFASQRPSHSAHPSFHSERQVYEDTLSQTHDADLSAQLGRFTLEADEAVFNPHDPIQRSTYTSPPTYDPGLGRNNYQLNIEAYHTLGSYTPEGIPEGPFAPHVNGYRPNLGDRSSTSPGGSDYRRSLHTPLYSTGGTPPVSVDYRSTSGSGLSSRTSMGQAALLDKKLSRLQQEQQGYVMPTSNTLHPRLPYGSHPYEYQTYGSVRMNPLTPYYTIGAYPQLPTTLAAPRGPSREQEQSHVIRSPLLEEFRTTNNKTTKRYELKVRPTYFCSSSSLLIGCRKSTTILLSLVVTNTARDSFNRSSKPPIAMRKSRSSPKYRRTLSNS